MIVDCDVSFENHAQALIRNNIGAIGRYFCAKDDTKGAYKIISSKEARQIADADIRLFTVHEASSLDLSKGRNHASTAMQCASDIGQPRGSAIYFAIEKDGGFTQADIPEIKAYFSAIRSTIAGQFDIGIYSNGTPCAALLQVDLVKYTWLAAASYGHDGTWAFYSGGRWTLAQVGPLDIKTWLIPGWQIGPHTPKWEIDVNFANGDFGSFIANPAIV